MNGTLVYKYLGQRFDRTLIIELMRGILTERFCSFFSSINVKDASTSDYGAII